jgi:hypothetical protein
MHLEGPWLSTGGKRRGKKKFRNAEEARKARELDASWAALQKKWAVKSEPKKTADSTTLSSSYSLKIPEGRNTTAHIKSLNSGSGIAAKREPQRYTGTKVKGIGTMHKSNAVPIFSDDEAQDIAKMRR